MTQLKALIIGAGIGGPVAALCLQRVGIAAEIYEARPGVDDEGGSFLNMASNGLHVLQTLGLAEQVAQAGSPVPRMILWNGQGKRLGEVRNGARDGLTASITMRRSTLQRILRTATIAAGIPIHFSKQLAALDTQGSKQVVATFADGSTASGDFLIGADGVHSRVRQLINPQAPKPTYTGLISTGGFTRQLQVDPTPGTQHFIFGKRAFFGYHVRADGEIYWFNNHGRAQAPGCSEFSGIASNDWRERLLAMHRDDLPMIQAMIGATEHGIIGYPIYDIATQPLWHTDNVVLLGDALHAVSPSSGQGASLAMEDAAVLASCLGEAATHTAAFHRYETVRRPRVERMVKWARTLGSGKVVTNPIQLWLRDQLMPLFLKTAANPTNLDWVYAYQPALVGA